MAGERVEGAEAARAAADAARDERAIARRLREVVAASEPTLATRHAIERWLDGDAGHLHRAGDLRAAPLASHRGLLGRPVIALKRTLRRLLYPLLDIQSDVNAANARVVTFLL